ncbi:STAS domain-containing protein [Exilibacterium tricleocarpae]|nr:STAS domain-containing protein [Exilibacterium tricleocarpae]
MSGSNLQRVTARPDAAEQALIIEVSGPFNLDVHRDFRRAYESQGQRFARYTVNLKQCTAVDSTGLGMLLLLRDYSQLEKDDLLITHCSRDVRMVLRYASFDQLFTIHSA